MNGDELRRMRERRGLDRGELAEAINEALGTRYGAETIARWERGRAPAKKAAAFLEELAVEELGTINDALDDRPLVDEPQPAPQDSAPGAGSSSPVSAAAPILSGSSAWTKACEELWEMIATGVGLMGAAVGNPALMADGAVIAADKEALGVAWGKLAETNATFRRMLVGMTEGGAWLQVCLVTGTTFSKCWQNHARFAWERAHAAQPHPEEDRGAADEYAVA